MYIYIYVYIYNVYIYVYIMYIYICIYTGDYTRLPVENQHACHEKWEISFCKLPRNFARPFFFSAAHSYGCHSTQVKLSGSNASFGAMAIFPLLQSCLYNCKAVSTDTMPGFLCNAAAARP